MLGVVGAARAWELWRLSIRCTTGWSVCDRGRMLGSADLVCAQRILSRVRGHVVRLREVAEFRVGRVVRCHVEPDGDTVIVKVPDREDNADRDLATVHAEYAALQFLNGRNVDVVPLLLGGDPRAGVLVLEDLGDGPSLASFLLADDGTAASQALVDSARTLGALHAETVGCEDGYYEIRERLSPVDREAERFTLRGVDIRSCIRDLPVLLGDYDLPTPTRHRDEVESIVAELAEPGDFLALSSGDPCPDNERVHRDGVKFFDFEAATFRHALVDAAHYIIPFPNCWCWRVIPDRVVSSTLDVYRTQLSVRCVQAANDHRYCEALARTSAAWVLWTLMRRLPHVADQPQARQRIVVALSNFSRFARRSNELPDLTEYCETLLGFMNATFPNATIATYPAFGGPPWSPTATIQ
jgi:hypothetical protein